MPFFSTEQAAELAKSTVRLGTLVDLDFVDDPKYVWNGFGRLPAGDHIYEGLGGLGQIDGLGYAGGGDIASRQIVLSVSGTIDVPLPDSILAIALEETSQIEGRLALVLFQLFDENWQTLGEPFEPNFGIMQRPKVTRTPIGPEDGGTQTVQLPVENLFFGRSRPAAGRYTDRDQNIRFPGDRFFAYTASLVSKVVTFPDY